MFWEIVGLISSWIGAFVIVNVFGSRFNPVFVVPAFLTLLFVYYRLVKKINFSEMKRGWIWVTSVSCEVVILTGICLLLKFLPIPLSLEIVIGLGGITIMVVVGFLLIYFWWAPNNLFFTFVREGTVKVIVKGHEFYKALIQFKEYTLDDPKKTVNVVLGEEWHPFGGLRLYGFPWPWPIADVFTYEFQWTGVKANGELEHHPQETLDCIIVKDDVYGLLVEKAEDKELMPLNVKLTLTVRIINPYKALFVVENWYETMMNRVRPYVRDFVTTDTYTEFIKNPQRIGTGVTERLEGEGILNELVGRYGIDIRKIEVNAIDPVEEFRKVTMAGVLAKREKEAIIIKAEAERDRITTVAEGETGRIDAVYSIVKKFGPLGELLRTLEAMEKSPEKGAKWIIPLPGMSEILSTVFPGRTQLTADDIKGLREMIQKTVQQTTKQAS